MNYESHDKICREPFCRKFYALHFKFCNFFHTPKIDWKIIEKCISVALPMCWGGGAYTGGVRTLLVCYSLQHLPGHFSYATFSTDKIPTTKKSYPTKVLQTIFQQPMFPIWLISTYCMFEYIHGNAKLSDTLFARRCQVSIIANFEKEEELW